jgi:hypothetical protein
MMWAGRNDLCHDRMQTFAVANGLAFLSSAGDHVAAVLSPDAETVKGVRTFLDMA